MVGQRLSKYIASWGLEPQDVPKVITTFLGAKYVTLCVFVGVGAAFQPLRRIFPRQQVSSAWYQVRAWAAEQRRRKELQTKWGGWYMWTSEKYWRLSDKFQASLDRSKLWQHFAQRLGSRNPRALVLGLVEGTILCKVTFPIWGPLELWAIMHFMKHRGAIAATSPEGDLYEQYSHAANATEDAQDMSPGFL
ncbi:unnamed protein product [Effrenium voratum]|uniref:Uncharacterized protein n=1 Tax=Effrenium voratum TaxID=2562239 RepID=A0AA36IMI0_9DINO|nr:unnamed protein product [Effrenium voratum]CAJ1459869.1 unnamed protein product [Effrenium voratum]